jgi:cytokinin dehydrogenase
MVEQASLSENECRTAPDPGWGSEDFGHIVRGDVTGRACPRSIEDLQQIVRRSAQEGVRLTPRAGGNSQSGQAVCARSVCLDLRDLSALGAVDTEARVVHCEPGVSWRQLLAHTRARGLVPPVLPLNLDLSVGGTLSVGGFGSASHRWGAAVSNVAQLSVVDGEGRLRQCGPERERDLFDAVLGGLGRCGLIASATLALVPARARVRTWYLVYDELDTLLRDQRLLAARGDVDHLEGLCSATLHGLALGASGRRVPLASWSYCLQVSREFGGAELPSDELLEGLSFQRLVHSEHTDASEHAARYDGRFQAMRLTGAERQPHPWLECILPYAAALEVIPRVLRLLPAFLGDLHRVFLIADRDRPRSLAFPASHEFVAFAVLPMGVPAALLGEARKALKAVEDVLLAAGGKRYLSGWLESWGEGDFQAHFGPYFGVWKQAKDQFDPHRIFTSTLFDAAGCH